MAELDSTLRTRFAQSKLVAKTNFFTPPGQKSAPIPAAMANLTVSAAPKLSSDSIALMLKPAQVFSVSPPPLLTFESLSNENLPTTMEALRSHVNYLLSLPLPVAEKNRLRLKYWALECRLEAVCLLLDEADENGLEPDISELDPACLDLSDLDLCGLILPAID